MGRRACARPLPCTATGYRTFTSTNPKQLLMSEPRLTCSICFVDCGSVVSIQQADVGCTPIPEVYRTLYPLSVPPSLQKRLYPLPFAPCRHSRRTSSARRHSCRASASSSQPATPGSAWPSVEANANGIQPPLACGEGPVGRSGGCGPAGMPRRSAVVAPSPDPSALPVTTRAFDDGQLPGQADSVVAPT